MALTKTVNSILPDIFKVLDLGERFLGLGSHTPAHRRGLKKRKRAAVLPLVKRIVAKVQRRRLKKIVPRKPKRARRARKVTFKKPRAKKRKRKMSKRRRTGSHTVSHMLHGGTGDLKPQYMTISSDIAAAADDYTSTRISLPVSHFGDAKNRTTIFEILSVEWYLNIIDMVDAANTNVGFLSTTVIRATGTTCTLATLAADVTNPLVIAPALQHTALLTSGVIDHKYPISVDTSDNAGNGILVATDVIFITYGNVGGTAVGRITAKILYRLSQVGITEYVGILQSQQ